MKRGSNVVLSEAKNLQILHFVQDDIKQVRMTWSSQDDMKQVRLGLGRINFLFSLRPGPAS